MIKEESGGSILVRFDNGKAFRLWIINGGISAGSAVIETESGDDIDKLGADALIEFLYTQSIGKQDTGVTKQDLANQQESMQGDAGIPAWHDCPT